MKANTDQSRDDLIKVLYCTEVVVALFMQSHVQGAGSAYRPEDISSGN